MGAKIHDTPVLYSFLFLWLNIRVPYHLVWLKLRSMPNLCMCDRYPPPPHTHTHTTHTLFLIDDKLSTLWQSLSSGNPSFPFSRRWRVRDLTFGKLFLWVSCQLLHCLHLFLSIVSWSSDVVGLITSSRIILSFSRLLLGVHFVTMDHKEGRPLRLSHKSW